jgi:hypothetical protein
MNNSIYRSLIGLVFWSFVVATFNALAPSDIYCEVPKGIASGLESFSAWFDWMCSHQKQVASLGAFTCVAALMVLIFRAKMKKLAE